MNEFVEIATEQDLVRGAITMEVSFDEYNLDVDIWYEGKTIEISELRPSPEELCERPDALAQLACFLIGQIADKVSTKEKEGSCHLRLHFEH